MLSCWKSNSKGKTRRARESSGLPVRRGRPKIFLVLVQRMDGFAEIGSKGFCQITVHSSVAGGFHDVLRKTKAARYRTTFVTAHWKLAASSVLPLPR